ncbi:E3 ubiquitin-protein ligase TRAIP isoform X1 [Pantherophis guttatus]|uniref:E3 ubiquitin-protein ligase TRAIP isoform X1 n=1 Tax=Pantherophis guttatus TaxID=94885 RepID=A0ABM3Z7Q7_PANGU|nr:E3 ubiquitin-protein ligase TRAIP isoform X1 [Pantherophis guttatus]
MLQLFTVDILSTICVSSSGLILHQVGPVHSAESSSLLSDPTTGWPRPTPSQSLFTWPEKVGKRHIINKLFFDVALEEQSELDAESLQNELDRVKAQLSMKDKEKRDCQCIVNSLRETLDLRNATIESLQKAISDMEMLCSTLKKQMRYLEQEQEETKSAKEETQKLRRKVKSMERIETLLHSQRSEVEEMIREMGAGQAAVEQLAVYCISLKKEYESLKESQKASNDTVEKLRKELFSANHKLQKAVLELEKTTEELKNTQTDLRNADKEITSLKKKIGVLQDTIKVPSLTSEALSRLVSESPAPAQFLNPKFHQPAYNDEIDLNATFDVETPKLHKTAVAPAKKIKLDKNPASVTNLSRVLKGTMENCSTDTDDEHLEDLLPSFIRKSVLTKKTVLNSIPQKSTGIVRIGYDGLGGRTKFIQPTFPTEIRPLTMKSKKRTLSKQTGIMPSASGINQTKLDNFLK